MDKMQKKVAQLTEEVGSAFWVVQMDAERIARGLAPEFGFDLLPDGRLTKLAKQVAGSSALLTDGEGFYLDPMEGFPLAVEALRGLAEMPEGAKVEDLQGVAGQYVKRVMINLWIERAPREELRSKVIEPYLKGEKTEFWKEGMSIDGEEIRRAAACQLACDCAAYRAVAEMRAIEAGKTPAEQMGGVLQEIAENLRGTRAVVEQTREEVGGLAAMVSRFWNWCKRLTDWPGKSKGEKERMDYWPMEGTLDKYLANGESVENACSLTLRDFVGGGTAKQLDAFMRWAYRQGKQPAKRK